MATVESKKQSKPKQPKQSKQSKTKTKTELPTYNLKELVEKNIQTDWKEIILDIIEDNSEIVKEIEDKLNEDIQELKDKFGIFPPQPLIFNAFNQFNFQDTKAVIIGQDPYHRRGQAMGLSFSVPKDVKTPPSLVNIYKELESDINGFQKPEHGDLTKWAQEGVLMLNSALTVLEANPNSHQSEWIDFTDLIIEYLDQNINHPIVFLLWGKESQKKTKLLKSDNSISLASAHPSPLSAKRWFGNKSFSKANQILKKNNIEEINWEL